MRVLPLPPFGSAAAPLQELPQRQRPVVLLVPRRVDQRDRAFPGLQPQQLHGLGLLLELSPVAPPELVPLLRLVAEPLAQLGTRGGGLQPQVNRRAPLAQAARPQPFDEDALAVLRR